MHVAMSLCDKIRVWLQLLETPESSCVLDPCPQLICMLPCRCLTRYALTSKETRTKILQSFLIVGNELGLFQKDPLQWEFLAQGGRLCCFTKWVLPLIQASYGLSNYEALWHVEPQPASPGEVVQSKVKGKVCRVHDTADHTRIRDGYEEYIKGIIHDASWHGVQLTHAIV